MTYLYNDFIRKVATSFDKLLSEIEVVHNFEYGSEFEIAICKLLRRILPQRFGICRGFVVNKAGETAGDDIIIYEQILYPTFRQVEDYSQKAQIPIEAAFAYIEAKHTLYMEGTGGSSLSKAVNQAKAVKRLCNQRKPVPLAQVRHRINLSSLARVSAPPGWPAIQNPMYTAVFSRHVRLKENGPTIASEEIHNTIATADTTNYPDLLVLGRSNLTLPMVPIEGGSVIMSPFSIEATTLPIPCVQVDGLAYGAAISSLLWALSSIELGAMPWGEILGDSLKLPLTSTLPPALASESE